ncbi:RidA family protein [Raineyella sp. LH-20]|uniref:RidA family protein n=1 Tax=Raineyella sp. LH-20 TaxID=3081204 RepID=UPI0029542C00|nr:RidA family protein [Raineyella sp. LH-20]WOP19388.1 RidA family protein [Raineyella sp. LH-20]
MIERVNTNAAPLVGFSTGTAAPLSQAIVVGDLIYCSGTGPLDPATRTVVSDDFVEQVGQTLSNMLRTVEAAGGNINSIVKCNVFLSDVHNFQDFNAAYRAFFAEADDFPARTTVGAVLHRDRVQVEIDCVATKA